MRFKLIKIGIFAGRVDSVGELLEKNLDFYEKKIHEITY